MDLEGLHDPGWVCDINSQERQKREYSGVETDTPSLHQSRISARLLAGRIKGGGVAGEVRVTDAHPGGGLLVADTEGKDEEGRDTESQDGATKIKFLRSFLIKGSSTRQR